MDAMLRQSAFDPETAGSNKKKNNANRQQQKTQRTVLLCYRIKEKKD
jgi:hypothetical protein